jgi:hypothetical protein
MTRPTRTEFEADLRRLGYGDAKLYDYDPCEHPDEAPWAVYTMLSDECCDEPATYGDLGWFVYTGCGACCAALGSVLFCGGMYEHVRIFRADGSLADAVDLTTSELRRADAPLTG